MAFSMWLTETYVVVKVNGQGTCTDSQNMEAMAGAATCWWGTILPETRVEPQKDRNAKQRQVCSRNHGYGTYEERNRGGVCVCSFLFLMSPSEAFQNFFKIVNAY